MAAGAYDSRRKRFVLFGGHVGGRAFPGDTWEWNGSRWSKTSSTGPSPRFGAGIAYDAGRGDVVVFGGADSSNRKLNDTWR